MSVAAPTQSGSVDRARPPRRVRWRRRLTVALVVLGLLGASWTVVVARQPGNASFVAKSADWFRDNHLGSVANWLEELYYNRAAPGTGGAPTRGIPAPAAAPRRATPTDPASIPLPPPVVPPANPPVANEGTWQAVVSARNGAPAVAVAQLRPDAEHTSVLGAVVWMNPRVLRFVDIPGTVEPGGTWDMVGTVGGPVRDALVAAFNGGFRFRDSSGGFFAEHKQAKPLVDGAASFVIHTDGTVDVGQWGRDDRMDPTVESVRQNLILIVDGGQPVADLDTTNTAKWGRGLHNRVVVWRSGLGVRPDGTLVYAASNGLTVASLADMLLRAGCTRAMELDINPEWVTYNLYTHPDTAHPDDIVGRKLLPDMSRPANRYLGPDARDFTAVLLR